MSAQRKTTGVAIRSRRRAECSGELVLPPDTEGPENAKGRGWIAPRRRALRSTPPRKRGRSSSRTTPWPARCADALARALRGRLGPRAAPSLGLAQRGRLGPRAARTALARAQRGRLGPRAARTALA